MQTFISLEEYITLQENGNWIVVEYILGSDWIKRYNISKNQFEKYGNNPPFGSKVKTLKGGHGSSYPIIKTLQGYYENGEKYFLLTGKSDSIVDVEYWWYEFQVIE